MKKYKSGFVSIIGRPNVGKSTLLNALLDEKVSIVSKVPQTTRYAIRGILQKPNAQIVFVDTPGMHLYKDRLAAELNTVAAATLSGIELILYVVDCSRVPAREEDAIMKRLIETNLPLVMVLNKIDKSKRYLSDQNGPAGQSALYPAPLNRAQYVSAIFSLSRYARGHKHYSCFF